MPTWSRPSQTVTRPGPEASRSPNRSRSGAGPRVGRGGRVLGEVLERRRGDRQPGARRDDAGAHRHPLVGLGQAGRAEHDLAVAGEQAVAERRHLRAARADPQGAGALRLAGAAQRAVEGVGDVPPGGGDGGEQVVGVVVAEQRGDGVVVLAAQPVAPAAGDDVHGVAHVEQEAVRGIHPAVRPVGEPRLGHRREHGHVAQPAVGLLELGLDGLGEVALALVAGDDGLDELWQALAGVAAPVVGHGGAGGGHELLVAGDRREVEQTHGCGEVGGRHLAALGDGADAVVQAHPGIPDGVPDAVGERGELLRGERALGVEQDEVVVAERPGVAAADAADRGERDPLDRRTTGRGLPHLGEPVAVERGQGRPAGRAGTRDGEVASAGQVEPARADPTRGGHAQMASTPRSPVRTRATSSTGTTQTLPSPIRPVCAALRMTSTTEVGVHVVDEDLDADLRHEVDGVLRTAVDLGVTALAAVAVRLADRHALDAEGLEGLPHLVELVRLDDGGDELHAWAPSRFLESVDEACVPPPKLGAPTRPPTDIEVVRGLAVLGWSMPSTSSSSGIRQPIVYLIARAMTMVTTPEKTMVRQGDQDLDDELVDAAAVEQAGRGGEQAGTDGAQDAADEVDADDVERVVVAELELQADGAGRRGHRRRRR